MQPNSIVNEFPSMSNIHVYRSLLSEKLVIQKSMLGSVSYYEHELKAWLQIIRLTKRTGQIFAG